MSLWSIKQVLLSVVVGSSVCILFLLCSPLISWWHKWQTGAGLLRCMFHCSGMNANSSCDDLSTKVYIRPQAACFRVITWCSSYIDHLDPLGGGSTVIWTYKKHRSSTWQDIPSIRMFCRLVMQVTLWGSSLSIRGCHPNMIIHFVTNVLLFRLS